MGSVIEHLVDGLITIDASGKIISTNKALINIFGYTGSELIGKNVSILIPGPGESEHSGYSEKDHQAGVTAFVNKGREVVARNKGGEMFPIYLTVNPLKPGNENYFNAIVHDVRQQKLLEDELRLSSFIIQTSEAILISDAQNRIVRVNNAFSTITGYSSKDVLGKNPKILKSDRQNKAFYKMMWKDLNTSGYWAGELWNRKKNGALYLQQTRISVVKNADGKLTNYIATFSDISIIRENEKRLEMKAKEDDTHAYLLRESLSTTPLKEYLQRVLDKIILDIPWLHIAAKGGIFLVNYETEEDELELFVEHNLGAKINKLCRHVPFGKCLCGLAAQEKKLQFASCIDERHSTTFSGIKPHGHYNIPIIQHGEVLGILVLYLPHGAKHNAQNEKFLNNIASIIGIGIARRYADESLNAALFDAQMAKKELQAAMAEAENLRIKAEEATQAKSQFLASMSHEIRTPMNGVLGMTELLLQTLLTDEQKEYAQSVQNSGESLLSIINDILDFSKIEAGKLEIENIDFDLRDMLDHFIDMVAFRAQSKGLRLSCFLDPAAKSWVNGDPTRIRQILVNLAGNAIKFTSEGEIAIYGKEITSPNEDGHLIKFTVRDSGIGIPDKARGKLFQSFSQVDASTTRKYGGTGLGLAICKQLSGLMGGEIGVDSEFGKGSTFWFTVHLNSTATTPTFQDISHINLKGKRAFVVDDNATNRAILLAQLNGWGCTVGEVDSGPAAIAMLSGDSSAAYDFMILDMEMPSMSGDELGQLIKAIPVYKNTPLIMLTSISLRGSAKKMQDIGFAGYLTKPVKYNYFKKCIQSVLALENQGQAKTAQIITKYSISENDRRATKILLVEDNKINQKVALKMLEKLGFSAECANNGQEAVDALKTQKYEIVFMDCQMPVKDGFEATREIRKMPEIVHQPSIIAMTAFAMNGDREKCINAGMDDYVSKPINQKALMKTLEKWVRLPEQEKKQMMGVED